MPPSGGIAAVSIRPMPEKHSFSANRAAEPCWVFMYNKTERFTCDQFGKHGARIIHVNRSYGKGTQLLVIENIPVVSCPHCGESYLTAATLREIDNIKRNRSKVASTLPVPVAAFA